MAKRIHFPDKRDDCRTCRTCSGNSLHTPIICITVVKACDKEVLHAWSTSSLFFLPGIYDPTLILRCLDASIAIRPVLKRYQSVVLTSGTISPLEMYPKLLERARDGG